MVVVLYGAVLSLTAKTSVWHLLVNKHQGCLGEGVVCAHARVRAFLCACVSVSACVHVGMCVHACVTPSPKQPFSFLGQLAINSARHAKQLFSSVPAGV